jgi:hypothetical protein
MVLTFMERLEYDSLEKRVDALQREAGRQFKVAKKTTCLWSETSGKVISRHFNTPLAPSIRRSSSHLITPDVIAEPIISTHPVGAALAS